MLPPALASLLAFHAPLSTLQREQGGAATLLTPAVNVLALNATYLPEDRSGVDLEAVRDWHEGQGQPVLVVGAAPVPNSQPVARLRLGLWHPGDRAGNEVVVEQLSRLHLGTWAGVLAGVYGTPEWGPALGRHLAARLEDERSYLPLLAYRSSVPVGALLWQARPEGGAALLWGAPDDEVGSAMLDSAAGLGDSVQVALPDHSGLSLGESQELHFSLLKV
ncbi:hypothetical protein GO986_00480 [Deinococcus sp. HMF7620]|uniref:Uncharacterized protein n=1 Tax=Deinococcus arboris TaxID=2682977 RepID=A0A7C9I7X0_9DEIO|nr:hypothetical protein [Deinococcus arboris]MVN85246.1 hypothetical protein [Deinococcus arboris]